MQYACSVWAAAGGGGGGDGGGGDLVYAADANQYFRHSVAHVARHCACNAHRRAAMTNAVQHALWAVAQQGPARAAAATDGQSSGAEEDKTADGQSSGAEEDKREQMGKARAQRKTRGSRCGEDAEGKHTGAWGGGGSTCV